MHWSERCRRSGVKSGAQGMPFLSASNTRWEQKLGADRLTQLAATQGLGKRREPAAILVAQRTIAKCLKMGTYHPIFGSV